MRPEITISADNDQPEGGERDSGREDGLQGGGGWEPQEKVGGTTRVHQARRRGEEVASNGTETFTNNVTELMSTWASMSGGSWAGGRDDLEVPVPGGGSARSLKISAESLRMGKWVVPGRSRLKFQQVFLFQVWVVLRPDQKGREGKVGKRKFRRSQIDFPRSVIWATRYWPSHPPIRREYWKVSCQKMNVFYQ